MPKPRTVTQWEQAEIRRSDAEASHAAPIQLRVGEPEVARYMNPAADTCFPLEYAYHLLGDVRGKLVLDYGCGDGENTLLLARKGARVLAVDISQLLIAQARQRLHINSVPGDVKFIVASAHHLPITNESLDVVFGMAILHHLDLSLASGEVRRVLRKGGRAIFKEPLRNSKPLRALRKLIPYRPPDVSPFERPLTDQELEVFSRDFNPSRSRSFLLPFTGLAARLPIGRNNIRRLYRWDARILRQLPSLEYYATSRVVELVK